jgi:uncharacterized protein YdeI (YjbR/CyaY-like superfamily)
MGKGDPRIDAYIAKSAEFAQPILNHIRVLVHTACPEVEEKMKWSFPHFDYRGEMMCSMAAFKQHCSFGFWKAPAMSDHTNFSKSNELAMGSFGRIASLNDLPGDKTIISYVKEAMKLNDEGVKVVYRQKTQEKKPVRIPSYFASALKKNKKAFEMFEQFSPGKKRDYISWLIEAKTDETRNKRLETAVEWIAEGKSRNWKYERK